MYLSIPSTVSIAAACINLVVAVLAAAIGWRGGWREMRAFALVALSAAAYNLTNVPGATPAISDACVTWSSRASIAVAGAHGALWLRYLAAAERRAPRRYEVAARVTGGLVVVVALIPGVVITSAIGAHEVAWLGVTYRDPQPTGFGAMVFGVCVLLLLFPLVHFVRRWREGGHLTGVFVLGLSALVATAANDALVGAGVVATPYLLDLGFLGVVVAAGGTMVHRFVTAARDLDSLTGQLEQQVEQRTRALTETQGALARAEKLAAIGTLAAGVAHEINNPTAAVLANLAYLQEPLAAGEPLPEDARECLDDSITSVKRITRIVRQLLDAGRAAGGRQGRVAPVEVARAVSAAVATARAAHPEAEVAVEVPASLHVLADEDQLVQVLVNLVVNAAQAAAGAGRAGHVVLGGERRADRVLVTVKDDGPGIPHEAQAKLFEPFFTTKGPGRGTGLGLAVSLGLMRAQGGDLRLLHTSPAGTTLAVELPFTEAPAATATTTATTTKPLAQGAPVV